MNKLFVGLAIVAGSLAFAQETETTETIVTILPIKEKEPIRFGITGGANAAAFSEQQLSVKNQKIGFHAGAFINIPLSQKFAIQPEVLYNQLGAKSASSSHEVITGSTTVTTKYDYTTTLNYVSVPLMLQMKPVDNFYIEAGPEFSYFINGKDKGETSVATTIAGNTTTDVTSTSETINKDDIKKFNIGLGLGLGYYFTHNLGINARYVNSLTHFVNNSGLSDMDKDKTTNRVFQIGLNYKF